MVEEAVFGRRGWHSYGTLLLIEGEPIQYTEQLKSQALRLRDTAT